MPTGTPIPDIREQLLRAADRVLARDGPDALTSRAVTSEAGVAKGIVHRHFPDFDTLLAGLVLARLEQLDALGARLRADAGSDTVADHVARALDAALDQQAVRLVALIQSRPGLRDRLRLTTPSGVPLLAEVMRMLAGYLTAERGLGRIALDADVDALALLLVGGSHLRATGGDGGPTVRALVGAAIGTAALPVGR